MKCAEVMEWMHRYLDQDLSRDEIIEMFRHIDNCPSCAEVFERLSALSKQLEKLPDVKAPFSLVDSILPQLEELDRAARDQSATRSEEQVVVPFSDEKSRRKTSRGTSIASRTGIGAAAAAVLLGIAIFNMPNKLPGAEVEQSLQSKTTALSSNEVADVASQTQPEAEDAANGSEKLNTASTGLNSGGSPESAAAPEIDHDDPSADIVAPSDPTEAPNESPVASSKPDPASGGRVAPMPTDKPKVTEPVKTSKPNAATKSPSEKSDNSSNDQKPDKSERGVADEGKVSKSDIAPPSPVESAIKIPHAYEQGAMGFSSIDGSTVQTWTSPDSLYAAELDGQQLVIFSNPPEGSVEDRIEVASFPIEGNWVSGKWSPDSMQFTYVIEQEGTNITKVYDIQTKASFTPSPAASPAASAEVTPVITPTN